MLIQYGVLKNMDIEIKVLMYMASLLSVVIAVVVCQFWKFRLHERFILSILIPVAVIAGLLEIIERFL